MTEEIAEETKATPLQWFLAACIAFPAATADILLASMSNGYALSLLWQWSVVPLGAVEIGWLSFAVIFMGVRSLLVTAYFPTREEVPLWKRFLIPHVRAAGIVFFAWCLISIFGEIA